ncbi:MAG: peptidylprolyl isomerase [Verrucomicrobiota bacterium JB023]|nr:peptidylprolyl isomerase [Verrucomicrobiota bacterium JB023]
MKFLPALFSLALFASCQESTTSEASEAAASTEPKGPHPALKDPSLAQEQAPAEFKAEFSTTKGNFEVTVHREWSPLGADRLYNLVKIGYFEDIAFFRAVEGFMVQFGIHGDPAVNAVWKDANINDDPNVGQSNTPGKLTFAKTGMPNSRSVQFFINYGNNAFLDNQGFTPIGEVTKGMDVVNNLYKGYGERPSQAQNTIQMRGNEFLKQSFPELDYINSAKIVD